MTISTLVVDDEPLARDLLTGWIDRHPCLQLAGEAEDGVDIVDRVRRLHVDLLFLDIEMPGLDGLATLRALQEDGLAPFVVFVTAWDQHGVAAFDLQAGDYLVKPVSRERFARAAERARVYLRDRRQLNALERARQPLEIRTTERSLSLSPDRIAWVEAASQYARIHLADETHLVSRPLAEVAEALPDGAFVRVHRSALVNLSWVREAVHRNGHVRLLLANGDEVPVARSAATFCFWRSSCVLTDGYRTKGRAAPRPGERKNVRRLRRIPAVKVRRQPLPCSRSPWSRSAATFCVFDFPVAP